MLEKITSEKLDKQLAAIRSASIHSTDDIAFQNAASVLLVFEPDTLKPLANENEKYPEKWGNFLDIFGTFI